jgi:hypothetical protein
VLSCLSLLLSILFSTPLFIVTKLEVLFVDRSYCQEVNISGSFFFSFKGKILLPGGEFRTYSSSFFKGTV